MLGPDPFGRCDLDLPSFVSHFACVLGLDTQCKTRDAPIFAFLWKVVSGLLASLFACLSNFFATHSVEAFLT